VSGSPRRWIAIGGHDRREEAWESLVDFVAPGIVAKFHALALRPDQARFAKDLEML
jgi:hypothetical protein